MRHYRSSWRATVMSTVAIAALTGWGTQAAAGPVRELGTPSASAVNAVQGGFNLLSTDTGTVASTDTVTASHGFSTFKSVKIESKGFDLEGTLRGRLRTHSFESLWQVYNLPSSKSWKFWVIKYKEDQSQSVLKETFHQDDLIDVNIDLKFKVSAAALRDVSTLRVGFETLRLELDGVTKDFTVVNDASGGAKDQNGKDVPVEFEPV